MIVFARAMFVVALGFATVVLPSQAMAQDDPPLVYKVKQGDTLYSLADRYFVGRRVTNTIAALNDISDPNRIGIGKLLRIPRNFLRADPVQLRVRSYSGPTLIANSAPVRGKVLGDGELVTTGANGFITFEGSRGAVVSLPSNTSARLKHARQYVLGETLDVEFEILKGRGEVRAPKLKDQERFRVRTPLAVTAVRGTVFRVAHNSERDVSVAEVTEGAVAVQAGADTGLAKSGFGVPLTTAGVGEFEALLPVAKIADSAAVQTRKDIAFTIVPLDGAVLYRTQIATDAGFLEVIGEDVGTDTQAHFAGLPNGTYFVRSRGVSATGIEGLSNEAFPFKRKRLGVAASAGPSALQDGFKFSWLADGGDGSSFAFQLWNEASPDTPIVDEVGVQDAGYILTGLEPGTYVWRVAATQVDHDGLLKVWSPEQKLHVTE